MNAQPEAHEIDLPHLSDERVDQIERAVFDDIARDRETRHRAVRRPRRIGAWAGVGAAAAVVGIAALVGPSVTAALYPAVPTTVADQSSEQVDGGAGAPERAAGAAEVTTTADFPSESAGGRLISGVERQIIATGSMLITVEDVQDSAREVVAAAEDAGGNLDGMTIGTAGDPVGEEFVDRMIDPSLPVPGAPTDGAVVRVRVPAESLTSFMAEMEKLGTVESTSLDRQDVTEETINLQAQVDAAQTSTKRLAELLDQAGSVGELIEAERALTERQAMLDSYQQQLDYLKGQVELSGLTVTLQPTSAPVKADPSGFGDGLAAGWNGMLATVNGIVLGLGFLLPWIGVAAVVGLIVWLIVRSRRRETPADRDSTHAGD